MKLVKIWLLILVVLIGIVFSIVFHIRQSRHQTNLNNQKSALFGVAKVTPLNLSGRTSGEKTTVEDLPAEYRILVPANATGLKISKNDLASGGEQIAFDVKESLQKSFNDLYGNVRYTKEWQFKFGFRSEEVAILRFQTATDQVEVVANGNRPDHSHFVITLIPQAP